MKDIIEFELDGQAVYVEAEPAEATGMRRISRTEEGIVKAETRFADAISRIRPVADALLKTFQEMSAPEEVALEFGIKFNAKAGAVFASVDSDATFRGLFPGRQDVPSTGGVAAFQCLIISTDSYDAS